jgi:hypothetical protein
MVKTIMNIKLRMMIETPTISSASSHTSTKTKYLRNKTMMMMQMLTGINFLARKNTKSTIITVAINKDL